MINALLPLIFIVFSSMANAQIQLYGQYVAGDSKEKVDNYERSMRLNGQFYYIEPHFNAANKLFMVRIINYDYVVLSDYHVVEQHAQRLVELMEHKYGPALRNMHVKDRVNCDADNPYMMAQWKISNKDMHIDIECKDGNYYHIVFTISAYSLSTDKRSQMKREMAGN